MQIKSNPLVTSLKTAFIFLFILSAFFSFTGNAFSAGDPGGFFKMRVIHTNDTHGNIRKTWKSGRSDISEISAMREEINKKTPGSNILILDAGDFTDGKKRDPEAVAADMSAMAAAGYDAAALGNHEVKIGIEKIKEISKNSNLPIVCANLTSKETGEYVFKPYIIKDFGGVKVGILGFSTPKILESMNADELAKFNYAGIEDAYDNIIEKFKSECDVRIVLSHMGTDEDFKIAETHKKIKLIVGGHTPDPIDEPVFKSACCVVNTGKYGINVGMLDMTIDPESFEIKSADGVLKKVGDESEL